VTKADASAICIALRLTADCGSQVIDCEDGTYLCLYTPPPDAPTRCELHIRLDDEGLDGTPRTPIRGSPFAVRCERGADLSAMRVGSSQ